MIKLIGYTWGELVGSAFKEYFTEPERAAAGVRPTLSQRSVTNYELVSKSRAGKRTVVSFNAGESSTRLGNVQTDHTRLGIADTSAGPSLSPGTMCARTPGSLGSIPSRNIDSSR
jgi:hypothetical protein